MTKQEFIRQHSVNQMPKLVQRVRAMGVEVDYMDELMGELDEMEALT